MQLVAPHARRSGSLVAPTATRARRRAGWAGHPRPGLRARAGRPRHPDDVASDGVAAAHTAGKLRIHEPQTVGNARSQIASTDRGGDVVKRVGQRTVATIGGLYERVTEPGPKGATRIVHRFMIRTPERTVGVVMRESFDDIQYLHTDPLGSPVVVTDGAGEVRERRTYGPFGERQDVPATGPEIVSTGYTGHSDDEAGLVNMKGRMYSPRMGRFLQPDPVLADPLDQQARHPSEGPAQSHGRRRPGHRRRSAGIER